jgi:hypothetical protein
MRLRILLLTLLLAGCQGPAFLMSWDGESAPPVMPLWERYQRCLVETDPPTLAQLVEQLEAAMPSGPEPPAWMTGWSRYVKRQPLRTVVDPSALGAACTLRAATVMAGQNRLPAARALYERVLARYGRQDWPYYHEQAKDSLAALSRIDPAVVALRTSSLENDPLLCGRQRFCKERSRPATHVQGNEVTDEVQEPIGSGTTGGGRRVGSDSPSGAGSCGGRRMPCIVRAAGAP